MGVTYGGIHLFNINQIIPHHTLLNQMTPTYV